LNGILDWLRLGIWLLRADIECWLSWLRDPEIPPNKNILSASDKMILTKDQHKEMKMLAR